MKSSIKCAKLFLILSLVCSQIGSVRARQSWAPVGLAAGAAVTGVGAGVAHWYQKRLARKHAENTARDILASAGDVQKLEKKQNFIARASQVLGVSSAALLAAAGITAWAQRDKGNAPGGEQGSPEAGHVAGAAAGTTVDTPQDNPGEKSGVTSHEEQENGQESDHKSEAVQIQKVWRGYNERQRIKKRKGAIGFQAAWRGRRDRKRAQEIRDAGARIVSACKKSLAKKVAAGLRDKARAIFLKEKNNAAVTLQSFWRVKKAHDELRMRKSSKDRQTLLLKKRKVLEEQEKKELKVHAARIELIQAHLAQKPIDIASLKEIIAEGLREIAQSHVRMRDGMRQVQAFYNREQEFLSELEFHKKTIEAIRSSQDVEQLLSSIRLGLDSVERSTVPGRDEIVTIRGWYESQMKAYTAYRKQLVEIEYHNQRLAFYADIISGSVQGPVAGEKNEVFLADFQRLTESNLPEDVKQRLKELYGQIVIDLRKSISSSRASAAASAEGEGTSNE